MLCKGDNPVLRIIGVENIKWDVGDFKVEAREYSALAFRTSGNATLVIDGKKYFVNTNDILYLPQNMSYNVQYTDSQIIVIHFITQYDDKEIELFSFENSEQIYKLFILALISWNSKEQGFALHTMSFLYRILAQILEKETKINLPSHFLKAISMINTGYKNSDLSVNTVCAKVGICATTFRQLFKKHYQKTPTEYITLLRREYARNLISSGSTIENASFLSGFNDPKYFARVVKKYFGCTPRELKTYGK